MEAVGNAAISALCAVARFHQIACDPATLAHQLGIASTDTVSTDDLLRAAPVSNAQASFHCLHRRWWTRSWLFTSQAFVLRMLVWLNADQREKPIPFFLFSSSPIHG